jgi:small multidrug resistance pump
MNKYILIYIFSVFVASFAQIILKISARKAHLSIIKEYLNKEVICAYVILLSSTVLTIIAYRGVDLKRGPILESVGYIYILLLSWIFLKEKITPYKLLGIMIIIAGVFIFNI